jgi:7-cyano-7-deazaguanine synthase
MSPSSAAHSAIVLLSGGLDSTVALALTLQAQPVALALTIDYGQKAVDREITAARAIATHYQVPHQVVALPWMADLMPARLSQQAQDWTQADQAEAQFYAAESVWVPNRNALFLSIAASYAEAKGAQTVVFGANAEEGEAFPDNTPAFRDAMTQALAYATLNHVVVSTPVGAWTKPQMVAWAKDHQVPLELVWSCYGSGQTQCGLCPSCIRLQAALA